MPTRTLFAVLLLVSALQSDATPASPARPQLPVPGQDQLREAIDVAGRATREALPAAERREFSWLYKRSAGGPVWVDAAGRMTAHARAALALLGQAAAEGLDPADYGTRELAILADGLSGHPAAATLAARFDVLMTAGVLSYYRDLHLGRVDPRRLGIQLEAPTDDHDFAALVRSAIDRHHLAGTAAELSPPLGQYHALKSALARYRALAAEPPVTLTFPGTLRPGDPFPDLPALHRLLLTLADLPAGTPPPVSNTYDDVMSGGVRQFQLRHGLDGDGVIGRATRDALRVPLSWRARQIELALERLRWLPDLSGGRLVVVNIPMFRLWAFDTVPSPGSPALSMAVIVGRAMKTRTPVFAGRMEFVIFRPYWNVPQSILRNEILPAIRRDPGYVARNHMEIVGGQADASPVLAPTAEHIARLGSGDARIRQRPGPDNALGLVKFMFPNDNDVYMHGTPGTHLFQRSRRDFSHGCIRVEDPAGLAEWVLARERSWTRESILEAMNGRPNQRVDLSEPIQVLIFYTTATVVAGGAVHFTHDIYGQDARLDQAL